MLSIPRPVHVLTMMSLAGRKEEQMRMRMRRVAPQVVYEISDMETDAGDEIKKMSFETHPSPSLHKREREKEREGKNTYTRARARAHALTQTRGNAYTHTYTY